MPLDLPRLLIGTLIYEEPMAALDDMRFERILRGFASHYVVHPLTQLQFAFERGEGFDRFERLDAFAYVDGGTVQRLRVRPVEDWSAEGQVVTLPPPWTALRFELNIRVVLIFWALALIIARSFIGGDWLFWGLGFVALYGLHIALIRRSLRAKLRKWVVRETLH